MNRAALAMWTAVALLGVLLFASLAHAASTPPSFSIADANCSEATSSCVLTIRKSAKASSYSKVTVTTSDGTAKAGSDYKAISVTLTFGNNQLTAQVSVPIVNDAAWEAPESFVARLTGVRNAAIARGAAAVNIADDDPSPLQTCPDGSVISATAVCAPQTKQCPDGSSVSVDAPCPTTAPAWVAAPLRAGGFARVTAVDAWDIAGPGLGRQLQVGEIVAIYVNGYGANYDRRTTYAVRAITDGADGRAYADKLEGVAPTGPAPGMGAGWYYGWPAVAARSCPDIYGRADRPAITAGIRYRVAAVVGGMVPPWQMAPEAAIVAVPEANPYLGPLAVVRADCLAAG
jgi:hypothetical protein